MKKLIAITIVILILFTSTAFAVRMYLPFRCNKPLLEQRFAEAGIYLDSEDPYSDGFIENQGSGYYIVLYTRPENLQPFIDIPLQVRNELEDRSKNADKTLSN